MCLSHHEPQPAGYRSFAAIWAKLDSYVSPDVQDGIIPQRSVLSLHFPNLLVRRQTQRAMTTSTIFTQRCRARTPLQSTAADIGRLLWFLLRAPILGVLLALEPLISVVLVVAGALELVAALFFRISGDLPRFPFWGMIVFSVGTLLLPATYYALLGMLAN